MKKRLRIPISFKAIAIAEAIAIIFLVLYLWGMNKENTSALVFGWPEAEFIDSSSEIIATGRFVGANYDKAVFYQGLLSRNNSMFIGCEQSSMACTVYSIGQITPHQTTKLELPRQIPITKWDSNVVQAVDNSWDKCHVITINLDRMSKSVEWVQESINPADVNCANSETGTYKYTLVDHDWTN